LTHLSPILGSFVVIEMDSSETSQERYPMHVVFPSKPRENFMERSSSWPCKLDKNSPQPVCKNTSLHCENLGMEKRSAYEEGAYFLGIVAEVKFTRQGQEQTKRWNELEQVECNLNRGRNDRGWAWFLNTRQIKWQGQIEIMVTQ
jgi:hypothetical protein